MQLQTICKHVKQIGNNQYHFFGGNKKKPKESSFNPPLINNDRKHPKVSKSYIVGSRLSMPINLQEFSLTNFVEPKPRLKWIKHPWKNVQPQANLPNHLDSVNLSPFSTSTTMRERVPCAWKKSRTSFTFKCSHFLSCKCKQLDTKIPLEPKITGTNCRF